MRPREAPISDRSGGGEIRRGRRIGSASDIGDAIAASLARPLPELEKWNRKSHCIFDLGVIMNRGGNFFPSASYQL